MLHIVEVASFCGDIITALSNILVWLDAHRSQPVIFRQVAGNKTVIRLGFSSDAEALAFASAFGGRLFRSEPEGSAA